MPRFLYSDDRTIRSMGDLRAMVRQYRRALGLIQEDVADAIGVPRTTVALFEQGRRHPDFESMEAICRYLEMPDFLWRGYCVELLRPGEVAIRGSFFTYYTKSSNAGVQEQRRNELVYAVKDNRPWRDGAGKWRDPYATVARSLKQHHPQLFDHKTLVPVPRSRAGRDVRDDDWPSLLLAEAMAAKGTDMEIHPGVVRTKQIRASHGSASRPTVQEHLETLALDPEAPVNPPGIVLVDDVVTLGCTMTACAAILRDAGWPGEVEGVAVGYTQAPGEANPGEGKVFRYFWDGSSPYPQREG